MADLSSKGAAEESAKASCRYHGILWRNTFKDSVYPVWEHENDVQHEMRTRNAVIEVYAYLHYRSEVCPHLEAERIALLEEIGPEWRPALAEALQIGVSDLSPRAPRRAYGHNTTDAEVLLPLFALDQRQSASLLAEAFRRDEIRRLNEKARLMRNGTFDERAKVSDDSWARKNAEIFGIAEAKLRLAEEAMASHDASETQEPPHG